LFPSLICSAIQIDYFILHLILIRFFYLFRDKFQTQISQQQQQQPQQSQSPIHNTNQNRRNLEVKKKVWSVDTPDQQQQPIYHTNGNGHYPAGQQSTNGVDVRRKTNLS
jgi:hypothetical protein